MNSMGGQPQNKLQAMLMGLQGGSGQPGNVPAQGPTPGNPQGMQQQTDPAAPGFATMTKGLKGLADMLMKLGDSVTANEVTQMSLDLSKLGQARQNDMMKRMQLDQKIGQPMGGQQQQSQSQPPPQGMM